MKNSQMAYVNEQLSDVDLRSFAEYEVEEDVLGKCEAVV